MTRTGGTRGTVVTGVGSTVLSDARLEENTAYTCTVRPSTPPATPPPPRRPPGRPPGRIGTAGPYLK
ncbi:hypothetical protein ABZX98_14050 [Streptomyces sp. NPDC002992]|uniref:hypothetical protein n=1 Tax=Streptomyces sp. NPDC002992 TaxID=3154273 RepID=UPI0033A445F4